MNKINPVSVNPVFTEFRNQGVKFQTSSNAQIPVPAPSVVQNQTVTPPIKEDEEPSAADTVLKYSGVAALIALPVVTLLSQKLSSDSFLKAVNKITANRDDTSTIITQNAKVMEQTGKLLDRMTELTEKAGKDAQNALNKNDNAIWRVLATLTGGAASGAVVAKLANGEQVTDEQKNNLANEAQYAMNDMRSDLNIAKQIGNSTLNTKALRNVYGLDLISQVDSKTTNKSKYDSALEEIQNAAHKYLNGVPMTKLEPNSNVWSVTAEFAPIKEGGLGSVPPEIQNNFAKLGITCPTILPMYHVKVKSQLHFTDDGRKGVYRFGDTEFDVDRAAMFKISKSRGDKIKDWQRVEVYVSTSKTVNGKKQNIEPLVFIKCNEYFNSLPYSDTGSIQETERFALFSKAVYELEKAVFEPGSVDEFCVSNQEAFDKIGKPDAMLLNDWHAGAMAALSRYKAPCENASNVLSDDAKKKIADMNMLIICHNAQHQGSTLMNNNPVQRKEVSENILNTLFDDYAADIVENAESGAEYPGISNVLVLDKDSAPHTNLLNMGICLSNIDAPVSKNYAKELETTPELSTFLQWAIQQKADDKSKTHIGIINGNDYRNINQKAMVAKMGSKVNFDLATYGREDSLENIIAAREQNKINFYNQFIRGIAEGKVDKKYSGNVENVGKTVPPELTDREIIDTPILVSSGRLVSQKGIKALCNAIKETYANWDENHKGQPKPIIYISGQDGEGGKQRAFIEQLKKDLGEDSNRVIFYHGFAPSPVYMMCGDFFLMPSVFEPCGLTQGESFAQGTPVIAAAVGGLVDTIKVEDPDKEYGILTEGKLDLNAEDADNTNAKAFAQAIEKGLDVFFNNQPKYQQMVRNAIDFDQSWAQPDRKGAIYEYADALGFDISKLPEINNAA